MAIAGLYEIFYAAGRCLFKTGAPNEVRAHFVFGLPGAGNAVGLWFGAIDILDGGSHDCKIRRCVSYKGDGCKIDSRGVSGGFWWGDRKKETGVRQ